MSLKLPPEKALIAGWALPVFDRAEGAHEKPSESLHEGAGHSTLVQRVTPFMF